MRLGPPRRRFQKPLVPTKNFEVTVSSTLSRIPRCQPPCGVTHTSPARRGTQKVPRHGLGSTKDCLRCLCDERLGRPLDFQLRLGIVYFSELLTRHLDPKFQAAQAAGYQMSRTVPNSARNHHTQAHVFRDRTCVVRGSLASSDLQER